jgi:hypothetical protein
MQEDGFEYKLPDDEDATFFRWSVTDGGKDIMLIDRFTGMPVHEFFSVVEDSFDRGRGPVLLALIATSIRAKFPDWTPERIVRVVQNLSLSDVTFIDGEQEETANPPTEARTDSRSNSGSPSGESKSSATHPDNLTSETSAPIPA